MDKLGERSGDVTGVGLGEGVLVAGCIKTLVFVDVKKASGGKILCFILIQYPSTGLEV